MNYYDLLLAKKLSGGGGVTVEPLNVKDNGTYTAPEGVAYSPVNVNTKKEIDAEAKVTFIDYDGEIVKEIAKADFLQLSEMPDNPTHEGLIAQGWNWTLADAKTYMQNNDELIIGQLYTTASGALEIDINVATNYFKNAHLYLNFTGDIKIDWGDGTEETESSSGYKNIYHDYTTLGRYTIKIYPQSDNMTILFTGHTTYGMQLINVSTSTVFGAQIAENIRLIDNAIIGDKAFYNAARIKNITVSRGTTFRNDGVSFFYGCRSLEALVLPSGFIDNGGVCNNNSTLKIVSLPKGLTQIGDSSFNDCLRLKKITIPDEVTSIGQYAFATTGINGKIKIPSGVTTINTGTFNKSYLVKDIILPDSVTEIKNVSMNYLYTLERLIIPPNVTTIGAQAFQLDNALKEIIFKSTTPPTLSGTNVFQSLPTGTIIKVPTGTLTAYTTAQYYPSTASGYVYEEY